MRRNGFLKSCAVLALLSAWAQPGRAQLMIVGNDEKPGWDEKGAAMTREPGHDTLSVIDMSKPDSLRIVATIPLINSIAGPPTNLAITPSRDIALVANSLTPSAKGWEHTLVSDNKVHIIDLKAEPPAVLGTVNAGKKPSGLAIAPNGNLALVANRDDGTITVLSINGKEVKAVETVTVGTGADQVSAIAISPDGKRALATKAAANKVALLTIDGNRVTYDKRDLPAGIFPYNVAITPDGKLALTADTGNGGSSDGNADTVTVIDLEANPARVIDHVVVGDSPEGLVISPDGKLAATVEARGSNLPKTAWFHHQGGAVTGLKIDGKKVTRIGEVTVGGLPEGAVFSPDGNYLYVGNFIDKDLSVIKIEGDKMTEMGRFKLPGQPASMRGGPQ